MRLPLGLGAVVRRAITGTYTVTRTSPARTYDANGVLAAPVETTLQVPAHVQRADGGKVADLTPEGTTVYEAVAIYTEVQLFAGVPGQEADVITIGADDFEVVRVEPLAALGGFYKAHAIR